jgi:hypothetical protein
MQNTLRGLLALITALLLTAVPIATVAACSCAMTELDQAVADADLAFIGRSISMEVAPANELGATVMTTWAVDRSRDPISAETVTIRSTPDDGANCGVNFATDERWLVLAYAGEGALATNGCMLNRRLDGSDPEAEAAIASMLPAVMPSDAVADDGPIVPMPVVGVAAATLLIAAVSLLAFRNRRAA